MKNYNLITANNLCDLIYTTPNTDNINNCALIIDALNQNNYPLKDFFIVTDTKSNLPIIKKLTKTEHFSKYEDISPAVFLEDIYNNSKDILISNNHKNIAENLQYAVEEKYIEQEELENNIRKKDYTYNSLFENQHTSDKNFNIDWKKLSTFEKAAVACEFNLEHKYCDISKIIQIWNENPEIANTEFNYKTLENTRKNVKEIIAPLYKAFETQYNIELNPPKYYMESIFINEEQNTNKLDKVLKEIRFCDDLDTLKTLSERINSHRPNHLLSEIRTYNSEDILLYERAFNRTVDYQNKVYNGKVDAAEFTNIYNIEKTYNSQNLKENAAINIIEYLDNKNISIIEQQNSENKKRKIYIEDKNNKLYEVSIPELLIKISDFAVNDKIRKINENRKSEKKVLFIDEGCVEFDKIRQLSNSLRDNFINGFSKEYLKNENKLKQLTKQKDLLDINHIMFKNTYINSNPDIKQLYLSNRITDGLTEKQIEKINNLALKEAEQYRKVNLLINEKNKNHKR